MLAQCYVTLDGQFRLLFFLANVASKARSLNIRKSLQQEQLAQGSEADVYEHIHSHSNLPNPQLGCAVTVLHKSSLTTSGCYLFCYQFFSCGGILVLHITRYNFD